MLGRCRLRRGVSLEVIVEEDDTAEVTLDPTPLLEDDEDEDDDDDDEDDSENGGSATDSPRRSGGARPGGGGGGGGMEERRKRRERRKTVGLSRLRSVSCETLTLLDTSDMDSCWSEWDEDHDHHHHHPPGAGRHTAPYVTLHHPISRRRILQSTSGDSSEDSGIEYHSNEDDQETNSGRRTRRGDLEDDEGRRADGEDDTGDDRRKLAGGEFEDDHISHTSSSNTLSEDDDIHDQETATESDDEDGHGSRRFVRRGEIVVEATRAIEQEHEGTDEAARSMVKVEDEERRSMEEDNERSEEEEDGKMEELGIHKATKTPQEEEEERRRKKEEIENRKLREEFLRRGQESEAGGRRKQEEGKGVTTLQGLSGKEALENEKVVVVETTPPVPSTKKRTIFSSSPPQGGVAAAEERRAAYGIQNKEVVSEELPPPHTVSSVRRLFEHPDTPLGHLTAWRNLGRFRDIKSNPSSKILRFDRSDTGDQNLSSSSSNSLTLPRLLQQRYHALHQSTSPQQKQQPLILPSFLKDTQVKQQAPQEKQLVRTQEGQVIALRKPTVRGFNVKKALQEDPRTFHAQAKTTSNNSARTKVTSVSTNGSRSRQENIQNGHRSHVHPAKHRKLNASELTDKSDTESQASDISEDSGLSYDSTSTSNPPSSTSSSSTNSTSTCRSLHSFTSDPSFKWIDPEVMAKIRSVGTTVIFFGPRKRPQVVPSTTPLPAPLNPARAPQNLASIVAAAAQERRSSSPVAAPRIVGVVRKKTPTPPPPETPSHHSRSSSPNRSVSDAASVKRGGDTSVVYNFTSARQQTPSPCV